MIWGEIPEVVRSVFADNDVWWKKGQQSTMQQFLSQYTLHDSDWQSLDFEHGGVLYAVVLFDILYHVDSNKLDWPDDVNSPYLCIRFGSVHQLLSDHSQKSLHGYVVNFASTRKLTDEQRSEWIDLLLNLSIFSDDIADFLLSDSIHITTFEGAAGNHIHVVHNEPTMFLCVNHDGSVLHLPDLKISEASS